MMMMMMIMMRDVLCNRTFLFFSTDRRKPLSLSSVFHVFSPPRQQKNFQEEDQKKKTSSARMQKRNLEVPPHKNNLD